MIRTLLCLAGLCLLPGLILDGVWLRGEVPYPAGILEGGHLPWTRMQPAGSVRPANPLLSDAAYVFLPWDRVARRGWTAAGPSLWNPHGGLGASFIGNPQSSLLDPVRLTATAASARRGPTIRAWLRLLLAGMLMFGLLRHLGCLRAGAFLAAAAFEVGGFLVPWLSHPHAGVALFLPGVLWAGDRLLRRGGCAPWAALAALYGLQFLAGHPQTGLHLSALAVIFWGVSAAGVGWRRWFELVSALVLGALLAAPMLAPFAEYLAGSEMLQDRAAGNWEAALPPGALATFGIPRLFGWPLAGGAWWGELNANETVAYIGLVPWMLAPLAFLDSRYRRAAIALGVLGLFAAAAAVGPEAIQQGLASVPGFAWVANRRLLLGVAFSGAVLGGLGLDALLRRGAAILGPGWWLAASAVVVLAAAAAVSGRSAEAGLWSSFRGCPQGWILFAAQAGAVLLLLGAVRIRRLSPRWGMLLAPLLLLDLTLAWRGYQPTAPSGDVLATTPSIEAIRARARPQDRVLPLAVPGRGQVFHPNTLQAYGLSDLRNFDAMGHAAYRARIRAAMERPAPARLAAADLNIFGHRFVATAAPWERLHSAARLLPGRSHLVMFEAETTPAAVVLLSYLVGAESYRSGQAVGTVVVRTVDPDGETVDRALPLRAGRETADAAVPHLGDAVAHPAAPVARTFRVRDHHGTPFPRFVYRWRFPWPADWGRPVGAQIRFDGDHGYLEVDGLGLERADGSTTLDLHRRPLFAGEILVYANPHAWPRAFLAPAASLGGELPPRARIRAAEILHHEADRVVVRGQALPGEVLVVTDAWAPGWRAAADSGEGAALEVDCAYGLFRAVQVPPGSFTVALTYRPWSVIAGLFAAALALVFIVLRLVLRRPAR